MRAMLSRLVRMLQAFLLPYRDRVRLKAHVFKELNGCWISCLLCECRSDLKLLGDNPLACLTHALAGILRKLLR